MNKKSDSNRIILCDALSLWLLRSSQNTKPAVSCGLGELVVVYVFYKWKIVGVNKYPKMMTRKWSPVSSIQQTHMLAAPVRLVLPTGVVLNTELGRYTTRGHPSTWDTGTGGLGA